MAPVVSRRSRRLAAAAPTGSGWSVASAPNATRHRPQWLLFLDVVSGMAGTVGYSHALFAGTCLNPAEAVCQTGLGIPKVLVTSDHAGRPGCSKSFSGVYPRRSRPCSKTDPSFRSRVLTAVHPGLQTRARAENRYPKFCPAHRTPRCIHCFGKDPFSLSGHPAPPYRLGTTRKPENSVSAWSGRLSHIPGSQEPVHLHVRPVEPPCSNGHPSVLAKAG